MEGAIAPRVRTALLVSVLLAQTVFFFLFLEKPLQVVADNTRYETAGFNVATGRGLSLPYSNFADPDLRSSACSRHPTWCSGDLYPTASYPPGYQCFIAAVYSVAGRSLAALVAAQFALLVALFLLFDRVSFKLLPPPGYVFVMVAAATYPFLARQAGWVMSDHLHAVLLFAAIWAATCMKPGTQRGVAVGLLLAFATLTRPYSLIPVALLLAVPASRRGLGMEPREALVTAVAFLVPFGVWVVRNAVVFGKFIPVTATGLGVGLYMNKLEWTIGSALDGNNAELIFEETRRIAGKDTDILTVRAGKALQKAAVEWMMDHPWLVLAKLPSRVVRVWVSMGFQGRGASAIAPLFIVYLGGLWVLGVAGLWRRARRGPWTAVAVLIISYWAFLLLSPAEARRTLPLRLPLLLFAGAAVADLVKWLRARHARGAPERQTASFARESRGQAPVDGFQVDDG